MSYFMQYLHILFLVFPYLQVSAELERKGKDKEVNGVATEIIHLIKLLAEGIGNGMKQITEKPINNDHYNRPSDPMHGSLMDQLRFLSKKHQFLNVNLPATNDDMMNHISEKVPALIELNRRFSEIFHKSNKIRKSYDDFLLYYQHPEEYDKNSVLLFAHKMISKDNTAITHLLEDIHTYLVLEDKTTNSAITLLSRYIQLFVHNAEISKTPQQLLNDLLNSIIYTEMKGFLTMVFSYNLLILNKEDNYTLLMKKTEKDFGKRINTTLEAFKIIMQTVSRELWRNNPVEHKEDATYTELKHVFQQFIINEYDISTGDECGNTCNDYRRPTDKAPYRCYYRGEICEITYCDGYLYDCQYKINSDMIICPSSKNSSRNYEYIDYGNGLRYGDLNHKCSMESLNVDWHLKLIYRCDPCFCVCEHRAMKSEGRFNLEPVMANFSDNYVITGARFVKKNRIIHIQIQEGQLLPNGRINASTLRWSKINENPFHYHTLQWENDREIHLDDIIAPKNYVLTGLGFTTIGVDAFYTMRLKLKAFGAPINFYNGFVNPKHQIDLWNYVFIRKKTEDEIKLDDLDIPTRTTVQTVQKSKQGQFLKFGPTGLEKDVGQSTIPFIDIQELTTSPAVPMSGVGIYHKSSPGDGGFLALRLYSYDFGQHLSANLPENYENFDSISVLSNL